MKKDKVFAKELDSIKSFEFNREVAEVFDDMVSRSVPFYDEIHRIILDLVDRSYNGGPIYDLGCSTGTTISIIDQHLKKKGRKSPDYIGIDNSSPMLEKCAQKLKENKVSSVDLQCIDINDVVFIKRHGVIKLGDFTLNRYYFGSDDPEEQSFLEVETDPDGNTLSAKVFVLYDVVRPMTSEDWEFWTSEKDGLIGYPLFQLNNEDETAYGIEWGSADVDKTQPSIKLEEEIYSTQEPRGILKHSCMLYGRNLKEDHPGSNEYCLVSSIETPKDSYIGIYTGVKYDLTDFQIIALDEKQETRV